jgi:hypothetical protein
VHPVETNAVTYIVQRMISMSTLFFVVSLFFPILGRRPGVRLAWKAVLFLLALFSGSLALFSIQNVAVLPFVILCYEFFFIGGVQFQARRRVYLVGFIAVILTVIGTGWIYLGANPFSRIVSGYAVRDFTVVEQLLTRPRVIIQSWHCWFCPGRRG